MTYQKFIARNNNTLKVKKIKQQKALPLGKRQNDVTRNVKVVPRNVNKAPERNNHAVKPQSLKEYPEGFMFVGNVPSNAPVKKERRCIFTVAIGRDSKWLFNITHSFMRDYAKKCGADFVVVDDNWRANNEHPCLLKQAVNSFWYRYDRVLYVDSDILIKPDSPNIFEEVPVGFLGVFDEFSYSNILMKERKSGYILKYVEKHNEMYPNDCIILPDSTQDGFYNMGVFLCSKDTNPHQPVGNKIMRLEVSPHYDQVFCNVQIKKNKIPIKSLSSKWNRFRSLIHSKDDFGSSYFIHYVSEEKKKIKKDLKENDLIKFLSKKIQDNIKNNMESEIDIVDTPIESIKEDKNRFICTIIVGDRYRELSKYSLPFIKSYANKCNADLIIFDEKHSKGYEHPILMKTEMNNLWDSYEQGCYIDLDMLVKEETPDVFDMVPLGYIGCVERGKSWENKPHLNIKNMMPEYLEAFNIKTGKNYTLDGYNYKYYNAGFFVCDKETIPYTKKELVLTGYKYEFYEQSLFNLLLFKKGIKVVDLPIAFNRSPSENSILGSKDLLSHCWISHYTIGEEKIKEDSVRLVNKDYEIK